MSATSSPRMLRTMDSERLFIPMNTCLNFFFLKHRANRVMARLPNSIMMAEVLVSTAA